MPGMKSGARILSCSNGVLERALTHRRAGNGRIARPRIGDCFLCDIWEGPGALRKRMAPSGNEQWVTGLLAYQRISEDVTTRRTTLRSVNLMRLLGNSPADRKMCSDNRTAAVKIITYRGIRYLLRRGMTMKCSFTKKQLPEGYGLGVSAEV